MSKINKNIAFWIAAALMILLVSARLWGLSGNPPSLNWDEASHGVNARSILSSGKDEWGVFFPDIFRAFGDYKLPVYIYLSSLVVGVVGLSEFSIRFVSALSGLVTCWFMYLIVKRHFKSTGLGLLGLLTALALPWHVFLSRIALEANLSLAFIVSGLYCVFCENKVLKNLGLVALAISMHTYNSARVVVPFLILGIVLNEYRTKSIKRILPGLFFVTVLALAVGYQVFSGTGLSRYEKLSLLSENNVYQIGQMRSTSNMPPSISRLVFNRPTYFAYRVAGNYVRYFSLGFLTQTDNPQAQFAIPGQNLILWINSCLLLLGIAYLFYTNKKDTLLFAILIMLAFLPAAITDSPPQALRPLYAIPVVVMLVVYGYKALMGLSKKHSQMIIGSIVVLMLLEFGGFYWKYSTKYPAQYSSAWQYGYKDMVQKVASRANQYDRVIITKYYGEPHIFLAFWGAYPVSDLMPSEKNVRFKQSEWYWTDRVGKYYFVNDWDINQQESSIKTESGLTLPLSGSLFVTREENMFANSKIIDRVYDLNGKTVFVISSYE